MSNGGSSRAGLLLGKKGWETAEMTARRVDFPELFSPTTSVSGRSGIRWMPQKERTFSNKTSMLIGSLCR